MSKTEIKDNYAKSVGHDSWSSVKKAFRNGEISHQKFGELENGLLRFYAMECLKKASESTKIEIKTIDNIHTYKELVKNIGHQTDPYYETTSVDKSSIHNENNLV